MIKYPLAKQTITYEEIECLISWLKGNPQLTMSTLTKKFEKEWAKWIGTKYSLFCNSGSSANLLMIYTLIMGKMLKPGDKVIVPAVGWGTTIAPIIQLGLQPVMVDVLDSTFELDHREVEKLIKSDPKIRAVMLVHVLGVPAHAAHMAKLCEENDVLLLEDACAALGSEYEDGSKVGTHGIMSSFSFYFGHQLSTIEGGMVNTNHKPVDDVLRMARSHGWAKDLDEETRELIMEINNIDQFHQPFTFVIPGFNLRSTDLQAKIGLGQLKKADWVVNRRDENHRLYKKLFSGTEIISQSTNPDQKVCSISFGGLCDSKSRRRKIVSALTENGIETRLFSAGNLGKHPYWKEYNGEYSSFPVADKIHSRGFFLPNYPELMPEEIEFISSVVKNAI